jgi:hypothetical protein
MPNMPSSARLDLGADPLASWYGFGCYSSSARSLALAPCSDLLRPTRAGLAPFLQRAWLRQASLALRSPGSLREAVAQRVDDIFSILRVPIIYI